MQQLHRAECIKKFGLTRGLLVYIVCMHVCIIVVIIMCVMPSIATETRREPRVTEFLRSSGVAPRAAGGSAVHCVHARDLRACTVE